MMSSSLAPDSPYHSRASSGKTPPPAPSAAYAKRAREIQAEERLAGARYRPPALRAMTSALSLTDNNPSPIKEEESLSPTLPTPNYPSGFRRARAGTLPSNVHLAASQHFATSDSANLNPNSNGANSNSNYTPTRPVLHHASTTASATTDREERISRLRSGSLTLPAGGLSNAFGPSIFSSSWLSGASAQPRSTTGGIPILDEMRSITSNETDEYDVHTLDYLGLDDRPTQPIPATVSELRNQAQATIRNSLVTNNPSRIRANTVSNPYRRNTASSNIQQASLPEAGSEDDEELQDNNAGGYITPTYTRQRMDSYESSLASLSSSNPYLPTSAAGVAAITAASNAFIAKGFKQAQHLNAASNRPRSTSVGNLDDPNRAAPHRRAAEMVYDAPATAAGHISPAQLLNTNGLRTSPSLNSPASTTPGPTSGLYIETTPLTRSSLPRITTTPTANNYVGGIRFPNGNAQGKLDSANGGHSTQVQTPSRSLWIGNLDSGMSGEDLAHVFAPYGAIESFRLLPEKECGFVNFVDIHDAIRAKEDVLNRLGGNIGMSNGQSVRIGFGKADSAPLTPLSSSATPNYFMSPVSAQQSNNNNNSNNSGSNSPGGMNGMDVQSTPTRALWIGSIPSSTTPATILSVFSPYGPIESARVLTHKNCGFINFERLDDAVRARKALNGRDVLGSDVGAIRIGYARVPVKPSSSPGPEEPASVVSGVGDLSVGATIHALRGIKGATAVPADLQVLGGTVENFRSNLLLSMIANQNGTNLGVTEQQMVMMELSDGSKDAEADVQALADFRPPTMYYTTIPLVAERTHNRRWDASKLRELRKRLDSGACSVEEIDEVAADFVDGEIVDLASDWLGNTVVQKLFERCSIAPRIAMLERIAPHLAMIGIHKNGTWAAQKIIECSNTPEEIALIAENLRPYAPPLLLDQFGNYVVQCCLRFGPPANEFIFDAMTDRLWEVAQGRFGARSMRACLESPTITPSQQRRIATAVILNSIPLATNPNGALLLTWLLDTSGFRSRYRLLAPRFTPHLSHLCTHKLASLTVLRIVNQKIEPEASAKVVEALFFSPNDHVLTDVLGDQVNGVSVVHKILQSPYLDPTQRPRYLDATKRVLIDLKVTSTQAYRRLIEEVGLPLPNFQSPTYAASPGGLHQPTKKPSLTSLSQNGNFNMPSMPSGYPTDPSLASMMASMQALQMQAAVAAAGGNPSLSGLGLSPLQQHGGLPPLQINPNYGQHNTQHMGGQASANVHTQSPATFSPTSDPFNPFALRSLDMSPIQAPRNTNRRGGNSPNTGNSHSPLPNVYGGQNSLPSLAQVGNGLMGMNQQPFGIPANAMHPQLYQAYMYSMFQQQNNQNAGTFHA